MIEKSQEEFSDFIEKIKIKLDIYEILINKYYHELLCNKYYVDNKSDFLKKLFPLEKIHSILLNLISKSDSCDFKSMFTKEEHYNAVHEKIIHNLDLTNALMRFNLNKALEKLIEGEGLAHRVECLAPRLSGRIKNETKERKDLILKTIFKFNCLTVIDLTDNGIEELPKEIGNMTQLKKIFLGHNRIKKIPAEIEKLSVLSDLSMHNNELEDFPLSICSKKLPLLEFLDLGNNFLTSIPEEIKNLNGLTHLYIDNNQVESFQETLCELVKLERLHLNNNCISFIPKEIVTLQDLRFLDLANNYIEKIPEEVGMLNNLVVLDLHGNSITDPNINFTQSKEHYFQHLTHLLLSQNKIKVFPSSFKKVYPIKFLDIRDNQYLYELPEASDLIEACEELSGDKSIQWWNDMIGEGWTDMYRKKAA